MVWNTTKYKLINVCLTLDIFAFVIKNFLKSLIIPFSIAEITVMN